MSYMSKKSIMNRMKKHYEYAKNKADGEIFAIFLQGSQNYINDKYFKNSDVDSRAIYLPTMKDICLGKDISRPEIIMDNEEHIDRFDIRKFLSLIKTPGINNYENLFTEYYIVNPKYEKYYNRLIKIREKIVRLDEKKFLMATMGISRKDLIDLQKRTGGEDYDIENFRYSRKRLANIIRFNNTIKAYLANKPFSLCLKSMNQDLIHEIRRTEYYSLDEALKIAELTDKETKQLSYDFKSTKCKKNAESTVNELESIIVELMIEGSKNQLQ